MSTEILPPDESVGVAVTGTCMNQGLESSVKKEEHQEIRLIELMASKEMGA